MTYLYLKTVNMNWCGWISRPSWYRGVTVLLPGWVIWKYWNCPCKFFSMGSWLVSALSTPNGEEGYSSSTDLNSITKITSIQILCIQAASPHLTDKTTSKPQPNCYVYKSSPHQPPYCTYIWNKYPKRVALAPNIWVKMNYSVHTDFLCHIA